MTIRPLTNQVLVRLLPLNPVTDGGLHLPDIAQTAAQGEKARPRKGVVIAIGPWRTGKKGLAILPDVRINDTVLVSEYTGVKCSRGIGENLRIVKLEDVLAVIED